MYKPVGMYIKILEVQVCRIEFEKDVSLHLFYEGVFDQSRQNNFQRINARIIKRF